MDKEYDQQDQARDQVQEETQRVEKERPIHIQIKNGKNYTEDTKGTRKETQV